MNGGEIPIYEPRLDEIIRPRRPAGTGLGAWATAGRHVANRVAGQFPEP